MGEVQKKLMQGEIVRKKVMYSEYPLKKKIHVYTTDVSLTGNVNDLLVH